MNNRLVRLFCIIIVAVVWAQAQVRFDIPKHGRRIQLDGFLLEWKSQTAKSFGSSKEWTWDAVNTPDGISGYIKSNRAISCSDWTFTFQAQGSGIEQIVVDVNQMHSDLKNTFYQIDRQLFDSTGIISVEWVLPWNAAGVNPAGMYNIDIQGFSSCGDTLASVIITGNKNVPKSTAVWNGTAIRVIAIAVLSITFVFMRRYIRRRKYQKESPHQST